MNKSKFKGAQIALICGKTGGSWVPEVCRTACRSDEHGHGCAVGELLAELDDLGEDCRVPAAAPGASTADRSQWNRIGVMRIEAHHSARTIIARANKSDPPLCLDPVDHLVPIRFRRNQNVELQHSRVTDRVDKPE